MVLHTATCAISMQSISPKLQTRVWENGFLCLRNGNYNSLFMQKQHNVVKKRATSQSKLPTRIAKAHRSKAILLKSDTRGAKMQIATKKTLPRGNVFVFLRCFVVGAFCKFKQRVFLQVFAKNQPLLANYCACSIIFISSKIVWSCSASS